MPIKIDEIIERAFEQAFAKVLDQSLQVKAEALFRRAFEEGTPLSRRLEQKIDGTKAKLGSKRKCPCFRGTFA